MRRWPWTAVAVAEEKCHCVSFCHEHAQSCEKLRLLASSCLAVRMEQIGSHWTDFHEIWYLIIFWKKKLVKIQVWLKSDKNNGHFSWRYTRLYGFDHISRSFLLRMKNVSHKSCTKNQNTHFLFSNFFFLRKSCRLWDNVEKYCRAGQARDGNMAHAYCMLDT